MRNHLRKTLIGTLLFCATLVAAVPLYAGEVAKADLDILGLGLEVDRNPVTTGTTVPSYVQTIFGGKSNDEAPSVPGLSAIAELTGPGITTPITLHATPGKKFAIPALNEKGEYQLQNIRLVGAEGEFLQQAVPSFATINVIDALKTEVRVRQLTPEELRERGISVDLRNYEVYEYTVIFGVDEERVEIPYPVIVDKRTHTTQPVSKENGYSLPPLSVKRPPRFTPPSWSSFELGEGGPGTPEAEKEPRRPAAPSIPAAIIVPNGFGVLHQFFAVVLQVSNTTPDEAKIRLDNITATIAPPQQMRVAKVEPAVSLGQPVPIYDAKTGTTYLIAGAQGQAEWTLEALKAGTHTVNLTVEATYQKPGQEDFKLRGRASTAIVVSDPRFQINFSHPDNVRQDEEYTAYAFITNMSPQAQHVRLDVSDIPACNTGGAVNHICRMEGDGITELDIQPGEMVPVPYKMMSQITGHVFAGAGTANDEALSVAVKLHMGVSASGIPLSPATLVMPHYAKFLPSDFIAANMQLLGLGYSLATAPLNKYTAKFPRVIKSDVFQRAQEVARAGQRIFVTRANRTTNNPEENRDSYFHLSLDLLSNIERIDHTAIAPELTEWDQLRRMEKAGRRAGAAMARQLETQGLHNGRTPRQFVDDFAAATSHRSPFLFAYAHGADVAGKSRPYALSVQAMAGGEKVDVPSEETTGWVRTLPYAELTRFNAGNERGELAMVGRWQGDTRVVVVPQSSSFTLHLIYPDTEDGEHLRTEVQITNATVGEPLWIELTRGNRALIVRGGANASATGVPVAQTPLRVLGAAQDLYLNEYGRQVSVLFNRPINPADVKKLRDEFALTINVPKANYTITRKNAPNVPLQIPGAALQQDARIVNVYFDKSLSRNANYVIAADNMVDLVTGTPTNIRDVVPRIDNDAPGAILTGRVLLADNTPLVQAEVVLETWGGQHIEVTDSTGRYMYEHVARDIDNSIHGDYKIWAIANGRKTEAEGAVRLPGEVQTVNLVFLGRGVARGYARYDDGTPITDANVVVGSTLYHQHRSGKTDRNGYYEIADLPVGPLTFSVVDEDGRTGFAANAIRTAGEIVTQDLMVLRKSHPGFGKVRVVVVRSDTNARVSNAQVGVYTQGYTLVTAHSDSNGYAEFDQVPAGLISIISAHFGISRESVGIELDLRADQIIEQTIIIPVPPPSNAGYAALEGVVTRDDPASPGDFTKDQPVGGAIITIGKLPPITANADGSYLFPDLPLAASGKDMLVFDPSTGRKAVFAVPTLQAGVTGRFSPRLSTTSPEGSATIRVRLTSATGAPVPGYRVFEPGFPPEYLTEVGNGVYELRNIRVPGRVSLVAIPKTRTGPYGDQMAFGAGRVDFAGQVGIIDMRLPGQGTVITRLELRQPQEACPTSQPCYAPAFGKVAIAYSIWDEAEQMTKVETTFLEADPSTQLNTFRKVPALQKTAVYTDRHPAGYAGTELTLGYDGDVRTITLRMESVGDVTGRVFAHDGQTPIAGALVKLMNRKVIYGSQVTKADGSFRFPAVQADLSFSLVAEYSQDGIYRKGVVHGSTPHSGGPVSNMNVVLREQSTVEGQVVDMDGEPVPLARFWLQELTWPNTEYGRQQEPLQADINGRFVVTNVFTGPFRISAVSPLVQEERGHYQGTLRFEGDTSQMSVKVQIGAIGFATVTAKVIDSLQAYVPIENTEVTLYRGPYAFDFATTDDRGIVTFREVPADGDYRLRAYSKTVGRAGLSDYFKVTGGGTLHRDLVLDFLGKVAGRVTDPEAGGAAAKGVAVQVDANMLGQLVSSRASADGDGKFSLLGIPEGPFKIFAYDYDTGRMAFGPNNLEISKVVQEYNDLHLQLEQTATLTVNAYLPNDSGGAGELAPLVDVVVEARDYYREAQGNSLKFPKMIPRYSYKLVVRELGGEYRELKTTGSFPAGATTHTHNVTFQSTGTVEVLVLDGSGKPVSDAEVQVAGKTFYTPADGLIRVSGVSFGWVSASARKGTSGASSGADLRSRSIPLRFTLNLGLSAAIAGTVEAEEGTGLPSAGTRVLITVNSRLLNGQMRLETFTDANGAYTFSAIPIGGTRVKFIFYGPDDTTIGHEMTVDIPDSASGTHMIPRVKIDATPPRVLSIDPPANSTDVAPNSSVTVTFSEAVGASFLTRDYFQLRSTATDQLVNITLQPSVRPDGTFVVKMLPPAPPAGQKYPLASNVLYRVSVMQGLQDTTGNALRATVGSNFTTVNYTEPTVVRVEPAVEEALQSNATFRIKFNKTIDPTSLEAGYGGVLKLEKLVTRGGAVESEIPLSRYLDTADPTVLVAAPTGVAIAESSFYRLTVSGIRDTQNPPNTQKDAKVVDFFSYDTRRPIARIKSPVAAGEKLVSGILYTAEVEVVDEGTGQPSIDVESVDWFDAAGKYIKTVATPPYSFSFTAPATTVDTTFTLQVSANDLSLNRSPGLEPFTWDVIPNAAPSNVVVTNTPASAYPTHKLTSGVTFTDEGVKVTVVLKLVAKRLDGSDLTQIIDSKSIQRTSSTAAWPAVSFNYALPLDLASGTAKIVAEVTDVSKTGTGEAAIEILADTTKPEVISLLPKAETRYSFPGTYVVELKVRDSETGIKSVAMTIAGEAVTPTMTIDSATGIRTYKYTASVRAKNADTRIAIVTTTTDNRDNVDSSTTEVIYERVDDATVPQAAWITPLDGAAIPFGIGGWQATLRIQATDDKAVTGVSFVSDQFVSAPAKLTAPKSGTTNIYEAKVTFKDFPAGTTPAPFTVTAMIEDAEPEHTVELPITLVPVILDASNPPAISTTSSISSITDDAYINKTLVVRGSGVRVTILVPLAVKNLIVLDGATVSTFEETKLDLTVAENVFIDADSKIDVTDKGYLGGKRTREDGALSNSGTTGHTVGGTATGGATATSTSSADGSHAGIGGEETDNTTNATYGSITNPNELGAGGSATSAAGGNGGGAVLLRGATAKSARFVIAGAIRADGGSGTGRAGAGAGGSVNLESRMLVTGPSSRITANGGDDDATDNSAAGGGGGRIAVRVAERFDVSDRARLLQTRGGRNGTNDAATYVDGGAGTIFVAAPEAVDGELVVSAWDEGYPTTTGKVRGTPLAGQLTFDAITVGPRALARFDAPYTVADPSKFSADSSALVLSPADLPQLTINSTTPAAGSQVAQGTSIAAKYTGQSLAGVMRAKITLGVQPAPVFVGFGATPTFFPEQSSTISLPATATTGETTLRITLTDRAGRTIESAPVAFTVINNSAPVIDLFQVTPADETYAGRSIAISAKASDDVSVSSITLASSVGTVTSQTATTPTPATMARDFSVAIPSNTPSGTSINLTVSATDGFAGRAPTTATATVKVKKDAVAPTVTIHKPAANQQIQEAANATFDIEVTAADAEVAVQSVTAVFEGTTHTLTPVTGRPNVFAKSGIPVPDVDGTDPVAKTITIAASDFEPNTHSSTVTIYIKPLIDPNAPKVSWSCSSPNAMYPPGYATTLSVVAVPSSSTNGVSRVEFIIDGATPVAATQGANNVWSIPYTVPATATNGTVINVRANATSTAGNTASVLGTVLVVTGTDITTTSTIEAGDAAWQNQSVIVRSGGTLTITGPHSLRNIVVLSGGKLIQKHLDISKADLLAVERLYVGCGGSIDVTGQGYARGTTYPGAGSPDDAAGGGHIGRGGLWNHAPGGSFGSIYRPMEAGGGGHNYNSTAVGNGGGIVRIRATATATIDGTITARGANGLLGPSAGGSVWIATDGALNGGGSVDATGGDVSSGGGGGGGGGAIALEYATGSGSILSKLTARGGIGGSNHPGGAGSVYLKSASAAHGDLIVNNSGLVTTYGVTDLPAFGRASAVSASGNNVTTDAPWLSPALVGHSVRAFGQDGSVRGTYRISAVANPANATPVTGFHDIRTQDAMVYDGYVVYAPAGLGDKKFVAARYVNNRWEYDNDTTFTPFTPQAGDAVIGSFTKDSTGITGVATYDCAPTCAAVHGIPARELVSGDLLANSTSNGTSGNRWDLGIYDASELFLRADGRLRGIVLSDGSNATVTLADASGSGIQAGDQLRGVYRFDSVSITNARVTTEDLLESTTAPVVDATSSLITGNVAAPAVAANGISIASGVTGPVVVGAAGSVADSDSPLFVVVRNKTRATATPPIVWNAASGVVATGSSVVLFGNRGGASVARPVNGWTGNDGTSSLKSITGSGFVSFSASQSNKLIAAGLAPADTTINNEAGLNGFKLLTSGSYEVWANGANANKNAAYTTSTVFRIEKTPAAIRWIVDGVQVHELTTSIPAKLLFDVSLQSDSGELHSIEYDTQTANNGSTRTAVAANGSFKAPLVAQPGDEVVVSAWDSHAYPVRSAETLVATVGNEFGVQSVTLPSAEITGGRTFTGTVTLRALAGPDGALVTVSSNNPNVTVPATVTVAAGQSSQTFSVTTKPVLEPVDVTIAATYSGVTSSAAVRILRDATGPTITITSPAPNAQYTEGSGTKIPLQATVVDDDSGVGRVVATISGASYDLAKDATKGANVWTAQVPAPFIDGNQNVTMDLTVTATDNNTNSSNAAVPVVIKPVLDGTAPTVAWVCSSDTVAIAGAKAVLRVTAKAPNAANPVQTVEFQIAGHPTLTATSVATDTYEAQWTTPAADGKYDVTMVATVAGGASSTLSGTVTAVVVDHTFSANATISATDLQYDNKSVAVTAGTLTISGEHKFNNFLVLGGSVTHPKLASVDLTTTGVVHVACNATIDVTGRGYGANATYPGERGSAWESGGSHIGRGGARNSGPSGSTYGSIYKPREAGGGGDHYDNPGGGVVRINADALVLNGQIRALGSQHYRGGAGGSVWITAKKVTGTGTIDASGAASSEWGAGGGGAIALEYSDPSSVKPTLRAAGGRDTCSTCCTACPVRNGAAGTVYVRAPGATYGSLTIDTGDYSPWLTELPSLGRGVAQASTSGAVVVTNNTNDIQPYFAGHWVEIRDAAGVLKGTWRIQTTSGKSFTLAPNGSETISVAAGDSWQGIYRFDSIDIQNVARVNSVDPIVVDGEMVLSGPSSSEAFLQFPIVAKTVTVARGRVAAHSITADDMTIAAGAVLTHPAISTGDGVDKGLTLDVRKSLQIDGQIDVVGRGYKNNATYPGERGSAWESGGSHMGRGGARNDGPSGSTYGSIYRPREAGGGGDHYDNPGGGVVRIKTDALVLNGQIRALGVQHYRGGAGGSVWITAKKVTGAGSVDASGAASSEWGAGGGGAIALEYTDPTSVKPTLRAAGGRDTCSTCCTACPVRNGAAGTIYVHGPDATYGSLTIDTADYSPWLTELPSLGSGVAQPSSSGATVVTTKSPNVQPYFAGHWVEIRDAAGVLKGTWRIRTTSGASFTLEPNGSETVSVVPGDKWQGVYRFDTIETRNLARISSIDPISATNEFVLSGPTSSESFLQFPVVAKSVRIASGRVAAYSITADEMIIASGAVLTHPAISTGDGVDKGLTLDIRNSLRIDGQIDVVGRGYKNNATYPGERGSAWESGGSHMGRGGARNDGPSGSTYGSIYRPREAGGGGDHYDNPGGGVVRIKTDALVLNGQIRALGVQHYRGGAGGSVWITAKKVTGAGSVDASGAASSEWGAGGGGAIALEYTDPTSVKPTLRAAGGRDTCSTCCTACPVRNGAAGTIYVHGPGATYGALTIDTGDYSPWLTELPSLGSGVAQPSSSGATVITDKTASIQPYFAGHWVEVRDSAGVLKGTWRIATTLGNTFTLEPNGTEAISIAAGDKWQGLYRFDSVDARNFTRVNSADPVVANDVVLAGPTSSEAYVQFPIVAKNVTVSAGRVATHSIRTDDMTIALGAALTHPAIVTGDGVGKGLTLDVRKSLTINGEIDVTGRGYEKNATYPGERGSAWESGGSHMGRGGARNDGPSGSTYGSIYRPREAGGGGDYYANPGGGLVRINADALILNGQIRALGVQHYRGGAGGSVWITVKKVTGTGTVDASGAASSEWGAGGGGAIALEYTDTTSVKPTLRASGGRDTCATCCSACPVRNGAAGTIFVHGPSSTFGDLSIVNDVTSPWSTELPSLGNGVAQAGSTGSTLITGRTSIQPYFAGHYVEIVSGGVTRAARISNVVGGVLTLEPLPGGPAISLQPGDTWRGVYKFDSIYLRTQKVASGDQLHGTLDQGTTTLDVNDGAPVFPAATLSQIAVQSSPTGDTVTGPVGAVTDGNKPISLTVTNRRTGVVFKATTSDGSFNVPVAGAAGDTFTLLATDGHSLPYSTGPIDVNGAIVEKNTIASLAVRPSSAMSGETVYLTITLAHPARSTGAVISLSSSSPAAPVPSSVTVPAGQTTMQLPFTPTASSSTTATITATLANSVSTTLTILSGSADLAGITLSSSSVEGGESLDATVTLGAPAPAGGALVTLSSTSPYVVVPPSITIAEGQLSDTFTVTTTKVAAATSAQIAAAYGASAAATLDLTPCAAMESVSAPSSVPMKSTWVNDAAPTGAAATGDATFVTTHAAAGTSSLYFAPAASGTVRSFAFSGAAALAVAPTDTLVVYALVNPCNPPRQISVQWVESSTVSYTTMWGESRVDATSAQFRAGSVPAGGRWMRLEVLAKDAGITAAKNLTGLNVRVDGGEAWIDSIGLGTCAVDKQPKPEYAKYETVWFDDALPAGAVSGCTPYTWDIKQIASGNASVEIPAANGIHNSCFTGATEPFKVNDGDVLFAYVFIDPCNPPREIMLEWHDGSNWNRRGYWGEDLINYGSRHTHERVKFGNLPAAGQWVRLEVPAVMLSIEGQSVRGMAFTIYDGRAWFDRAGKYSRVNVALKKTATQSSTYNNQAASVASMAVDGELGTINHTNHDANGWLQVDLGAVYPVQNVTIKNRTDCCDGRLRDFDVFVSEVPFTSSDRAATIAQAGVYRYHFQGTAWGLNVNFDVNRKARYVRVQLGIREWLHVRELQVWAAGANGPINVGGGSRATASSTWDATWSHAMHAFDGNTNYRHSEGASTFHTASSIQPWLETDLQSVQHISTIDIIRRSDPYDSTGAVYVLVSDVPFTSKDLAATLAQPGVSAYHYHATWDRQIQVNRTGRYVRVQKSGTAATTFGFGEMRIWSHGKPLGAMSKPENPTGGATE